jgi:predicted Zn finger-like uncharacterized protein
MKATCPSCQAVFTINDSKIPEKGCHARCPKCQNRFFLQKEPPVKNKTAPIKKITCPKCGFSQPKSETCLECGIVFAKYHQPHHDPGIQETFQPVRPENVRHSKIAGFPERSKNFPFISVALIIIAGIAGVLIYLNYISPYLSAGNFTNALAEFGARNLDLPEDEDAVEPGDTPYRIGKIFIVIPEHDLFVMPRVVKTEPPEIHRTWYQISRSMRADKPEEVDTLIRISKQLRKAIRYQKIGGVSQKVLSMHVVNIDVYNWRAKTFIGRWTIDPGNEMKESLMEEELNEMIEKTSNETILRFIESMPEKTIP